MHALCGIDSPESTHDIGVSAEGGLLFADRRISDDGKGVRPLLDLLTKHGDTGTDPITVAMGTSR